MFVEKPKEEVYDVVKNEVGNSDVVVDVSSPKYSIRLAEFKMAAVYFRSEFLFLCPWT